MYFQSSKPVDGDDFFNRAAELKTLLQSVVDLKKGSTQYLSLLGMRKVGKTSLLKQFIRSIDDPDIIPFYIDCWEKKATPRTFFLNYLAQSIDTFLFKKYTNKISRSVKTSLASEEQFLTILVEIKGIGLKALDDAASLLLSIYNNKTSDALFSSVIHLPEKLAAETGTCFIAILDEFQELQDLNRFKAIKKNIGDIFAFFRACWQQHKRINYIIAGSKISLLKQMLTAERSPFFQHFKIMHISSFTGKDAFTLLKKLSTLANNPLPDEQARRLIDLVGTNPFYLQVLGSELCLQDQLSDDTFKLVLQDILFKQTGRLYLYFQNIVSRLTGRSASLERTLILLARKPGRLSELAKELNVGTGTCKSWLNRISDLVQTEDGIYYIADKALALWLSVKSDIGPVLPPLVLGNEAEKLVARYLASLGFELIFQSRASRGAFDLLGFLHQRKLGIQVKKGNLPFYLPGGQLKKILYWAGELDWIPLLVIVSDERLLFYDPRKLQVHGSSVRIDAASEVISNLLVYCKER